MPSEQEFAKLKRTISKIRSDADRARGGWEQVMRAIKTEFGCATLEEAEQLLCRMTRETEKLRVRYDKAVRSFKKKYGGLLEGGDGEED